MDDPANAGCKPRAGDLARLVLARASARVAVSRAYDAYTDDLVAAFRKEVGACVTCVSPFAVALLEGEGLQLDHLVHRITPVAGWPFYMPATGAETPAQRRPRRSYRLAPIQTARRLHGVNLRLLEGGRVRLHVLDHSIEVGGRIGPVGVRSAHGELHLSVPGSLPRGFRESCIGALASEMVQIAALRGRDWRVAELLDPTRAGSWTFVVKVGSQPFTMPWTRSK